MAKTPLNRAKAVKHRINYMKILAIDTATEACSAALLVAANVFEGNTWEEVRHSKREWQIDGVFEVCPQQHSQQLLPMVDLILKRNNLQLDDLDAIAYGRGPGSFTGVRIAASTAQGLALGAGLPVIEVSTLQTMAQQCFEIHQDKQDALVLIDARMKEVYCARYTENNGIANLSRQERVLQPGFVLQEMQSKNSESLILAGTGFETYADLFKVSELTGSDSTENCSTIMSSIRFPDARYMLDIALYSVLEGQSVSASEIKPVYVRDTVTWKKLPGK